MVSVMKDKDREGSFGIRQLDNIKLGSIKKGDFGLIHGPSGTGKTSFSLHFLFEGSSNGENVCIITNGSKSRLLERISTFSTFDPKWLKEGYLFIFRIQDMMSLVGLDFNNPGEGDYSLFYKLLIDTLDNMDIKRFILDPLSPILRWVEKGGRKSFLSELKVDLQNRDVMGFMVLDDDGMYGISGNQLVEPNIFDVVIRFEKEYEKATSLNTLRIQRWNSSVHSRNTYAVDITEEGVILVPRIKSSEVK